MLLIPTLLSSKVVINEIQYAPESPEPEWIEIYNTENLEVKLNEFTVSDKVTTSEPIDLVLQPNSFAIITKNSDELIQKYGIDSELIFTTNLPTLNNTDDEVVIATENITLDSVHYDSDWGEKGKSLERVNYFAEPNDENNWNPSEINATPLQINSVSKYIDLRLVSANLNAGGILAVVENIGNISSENFSLSLEVNGTVLGDYGSEGINEQSDSEIYLDFSKYGYIPELNDELIITIIAEKDVDLSNNSFKLFIPIQTEKNAVLINEIMYDIDDNHYEFIEIYNNSDTDIKISNWYIADEADINNNRYNLITTNSDLPKGEYAIIVNDSIALESIIKESWDRVLFTKRSFSLNKSSDIICLYNENKKLIDSLAYADNWHEDYLLNTKNISLEKIRPTLLTQDEDNWKSCTDDSGNTVLLANSYSDTSNSVKNITATPNPFSPVSSSEPYIIIDYKLTFQNAIINCDIYYPNGTKALNVIQSKYVSNSGIVSWNGRDEGGNLLPVGPYVALIEATNQDSGKSEILKVVIVIAN